MSTILSKKTKRTKKTKQELLVNDIPKEKKSTKKIEHWTEEQDLM